MSDKDCSHCDCTAIPTNSSVHQTISEMDWERGIWYAALNGDEDRVESIIGKSKDPETAVNETDNSGYTALHYAARNGHVSVCRLLLQYGAKINAQTRSGKATPLHKAAVGGKIGAVKLLIQKGADIVMQDDDGQTALHKAVDSKHHEVVKTLIEACPTLVSIKDNKGNVAISDTSTNIHN